MAGAKEVAAVAAKMKAGQSLTVAETKLAQAAQPAISAAIARMESAGGVRTGPLEVAVPTTSVAGFVPSVGRAAARVPYRVPVRLPEGAVARAKADVPQALPAPGAATAAPTTAPSVPREAPVNVLPPGTVTIPMPGPAAAVAVAVPPAVSAAMAEPFNWALDTANQRGLDLEDPETDHWNALLSEHLEIVRSAIDAGEPVSVKAFQVYDLSVPFYDQDPATGAATLNAQSLRDYEEYLSGQEGEYRQEMADAGGQELLAAVIDLGGLPAPKSGVSRAVFSGELKSLFETAQGAGKGKGSDNQKGVFINQLFRRDGMDLDDMTQALRQRGFRVETEADLLELLDNRLRSGREIFGMATQDVDDVPLEMRRTRRAAGPAVPTGGATAGGGDAAATTEPRTDPVQNRTNPVQNRTNAGQTVTNRVETATNAVATAEPTVKPPKKLYRGEAPNQWDPNVRGMGTFALGKGRYSTTDKKFAGMYGEVKEVSPEEYWPRNPLVLPGTGDAAGLLATYIARNTNFRNIREFNAAYPDPGQFVREQGFDGIIAGNEVVKYVDEAPAAQAGMRPRFASRILHFHSVVAITHERIE
jgi:hypothetical protein